MTKFAVSTGVIFSIIVILILQAVALSPLPPAYGSFPSIPVGNNPSAVAVNNKTGIAYIANNGSNSVSMLSGKDFFVFMTMPTGLHPMGIAVNNVTNKIYVANNGSNTVTVIDGKTNSFNSISVGTNPVGIAVNYITNKTYVANNGSSSVTVIPSTGNPFTISGAPYSFNKPVSIAVNSKASENRTYVANSGDNSVTVIPKSGLAYKLLGSTYSFAKPVSVAINPVTNRTYIANNGTGVNTITIIKTDNTFSTLTVQNNPVSIAVNPVTNRTYIVNQGSNSVTVIKGSVEPNVIYQLTGFNKPVSIAIDPHTNATYIVNRGNNTVSIIPGGNTPLFNSPSAPSNVQALPGNVQVTISWSTPTFNGSSPIATYTIQQSNDFGQHFTTAFSNSGTLLINKSKIIHGLTNDVPVIFRVNAANAGFTGPASANIFAMPGANPVGQFIAPPAPPSAEALAEMISKGLSPGFIMPSPQFLPSGTFNPFSAALTAQTLAFTSPALVSSNTMFADYNIQTNSPPSNWDANNVWSVPPSIVPIQGDPGKAALFKMSQVLPNFPLFMPVTGASDLLNGGNLKGVKISLATGNTANNLQVNSKFLSSPPPGASPVSGAAMYLSFSLSDNSGLNYGDPSTFASPPSVSFTLGPQSGTVPSPTFPTNTVNAAITCPQASLSLLGGSSSGITVSRDTAGDTNTDCGYTATVPHFSDYAATTQGASGHGAPTSGAAPSFTTGFSASETPLSIDGTGFKLNSHSNTGTIVTLPTGKPFVLKMLLSGSQSSSDVQHISIFTNLRDKAREVQQSDTVISWDKSQPLSISDPHHYFGPVTVSTTPNGNKLEVDFNIAFANPMEKSDIVIRAWSTNLYSSDTYVLDAWQAVASNTASPVIQSTPQPTTPQPIQSTPQTTPQNEMTQPQASSSDILLAIKDWGGYSSHPITDSELLKAMNINDATSIPGWVSKTTKWVADGSISPQEFQAAISYLHQVHAIK